ncbi:MAG TPA: cytochrome C, partial [Oribacterium sp.]|nr:cytochrome C [Oribacterium sp.]
TYTIYNTTGENVTELYVYAVGSSDKGTNYAESGLKNDASVDVSETMDASETEKATFTLEYKTESGREGSFNTLHFETVPISLIAEDAMTGATPLAFQAPASK